ncbi:MAG TPA: S8 family serine peptidase [Blastocatellia bacterium]|nr:S8 family serine peptidase [Blastocatellia bacterium]
MKRRSSLVAVLMLVLAMQASSGLFGGVRAQVRVRDDGTDHRRTRATADRVSAIIELESEPVAIHERGTARLPRRGIDFEAPAARAYESRLEGEQRDLVSRAALMSPGIRVRTNLRKLANAVSVEAGAGELAAISALPGVKRVQLTREYHSTIDASVPLINAPAIWEKLGGVSVAGQGMKIAILDTGIDTTNPLFMDAGYTAPAGFPRATAGNEFLTNNKVIVAKGFVSNNNTSALDENGHGSNVAGIAAGDSGTISPLATLSGVAPRAFLGNYRVLDASGSGSDDFITRALEEATTVDGFDVVNMSFGGEARSTLSLLDQAVETAVNVHGTIVVASAGNDGDGGVDDEMTVESPGIAPSAITVAAASNAHIVGPVITVDQPAPVEQALVKIGSSTGNAVDVGDGLTGLPFVDVDPQGRGCGTLDASAFLGKVALIERGVCSFADKVNHVDKVVNGVHVGARAVIIFNKDVSEGADGGDNIINMDVSGTSIPSVFISRSAGLALRAFLAANPGAILTIKPLGTGSFASDVLATFSSRGPSVIQGLKPDITAPGVIIYSAAITAANPDGVSDPSGFLAISGTSQAAPHVAGAAALIKQLHPDFTPVQVKSALMSSASRDVFTTVNKTARVPVLAQGAGRVDLAAASSVDATFSPASLSFGIKKRMNQLTLTADLAFTNVTADQNTFNFNVEQLDQASPLVVSVSSNSVTRAAGQTGHVTVSIFLKKKKKAEKRDYTGYVNLTDSLGQTLHVPYWVRFK